MKSKISKSNENMKFFNALIDEIRINGHERIRAKARLAQGEAMADALVGSIGFVRRLFRSILTRPVRRTTTSAG